MSYREDITITYNKYGWDDFVEELKSGRYTQEQVDSIIELFNYAEPHLIDSDQNHLLYFSSIKSGCDDFELLLKINNKIDVCDWSLLSVGEDGCEDEMGGLCENPFNCYVTKELKYSTVYAQTITDSGLGTIVVPIAQAPMSVNTKPIVIIDDYTCAICGNTKCSSNEKSCWKCGSPIN